MGYIVVSFRAHSYWVIRGEFNKWSIYRVVGRIERNHQAWCHNPGRSITTCWNPEAERPVWKVPQEELRGSQGGKWGNQSPDLTLLPPCRLAKKEHGLNRPVRALFWKVPTGSTERRPFVSLWGLNIALELPRARFSLCVEEIRRL